MAEFLRERPFDAKPPAGEVRTRAMGPQADEAAAAAGTALTLPLSEKKPLSRRNLATTSTPASPQNMPPLPLSFGPWPLSPALCSSNDLCGEQRLHKTVRRIHGPVFQRIDVASDIRMIVEPSAHVLVKPE